MKGYGQFCSIARALDFLGERWSLLLVRELLSGSSRFSEIQRGIPRISRTMLAARLKELEDKGVITRISGASGPTYRLTPAGLELQGAVQALGVWGQRWLPRSLPTGELDSDVLLWDMHRRVRTSALPASPVLVRIELSDSRNTNGLRYLLLRRSEVSLCTENPGFPEELRLRSPLRTLTAWWRGDISQSAARSAGMILEGRREWVRSFPTWFERYLFAEIRPASGE